MSSSDPFEGQNPFEGLQGMFSDLARLFASQGPINWTVAQQLATWAATDGTAESNVEPLERIRFEELVRVADLRVADATGLSTSVAGGIPAAVPVTRSQWVVQTLEAFRPYLQRLAESLSAQPDEPEAPAPDASSQLLGDITKVIGPALLGMQSGFMVGHLAKASLGQYDLPVPRPPADQLVVIPRNINALIEGWSLNGDDARLWVCFRELTYHAVLGRPHVHNRLESLLLEYVGGFEVNPEGLEASLGDIDPTDVAGMQSLLGNPEALLGAVRSPQQNDVLKRIQSLGTVIEGYVEHIMDTAAQGVIGTYGMVNEAMRRQRVEMSQGAKFAGRLLGFESSSATGGSAFVRGVIERAGDEGLAQLWESERTLPTPAEVEAPGLWLARIEIPDD